MSLFVLLAVIIVAFLLSSFLDIFPGFFWGWLHAPWWLLASIALLFVSWAITSPGRGPDGS